MRFNLKFFYLFSIVAAISLFSCNKPSETGSDIVGNNDGNLNVFYTDTFQLTTYSKEVDSMKTNGLTRYLLGSYHDDVFGVTNAAIYTQLRLSSNDIDFGPNPVCDSIVLSLVYDGIHADENAQHTIYVHELDDDLYIDSNYYHFDERNVNSTPVGQGSYKFNYEDSVSIDGEKAKPQLRIKLDNSFAQKIFSKSGQIELSDNDNFKDFIKGLRISADKINSPGGSIGYFNLLDAQSEMRIYYSNDDNDSLNIGFLINNSCAMHSTYDHFDYVDADVDVQNQILNSDTSLGQQTFYLQSLGGIKGYIKFPNIKDLVDSGIVAINRAEIVIDVDPNSTSSDFLPNSLALVRINESGTDVFLDDYIEGTNYFGGILEDNQYKMNVSIFVQKLLTGEYENNGLHLFITGSAISADRAILNGPEANSGKSMKLRIYYSKIK